MTLPRRILKDWVTAWKSLPIVLRRRLFIGGLLLLGLDCTFLILTSEPFLIWFAYRFRSEDPLLPSDAIVVLIGSLDRATRAAELYRQGLASIILMGQMKTVPYDETASHRQVLLQNGVPTDAIQILPGELIKNTHDEALRVRDYVRTHQVRRIIVVTTAYHTARARWTFQRVLRSSGVDIRMTSSQDPRFAEADWFMWDDGVRLYLSETLKNLYYRLVY
jgi:uncharacterized SAM-binding protein YcdF (DUF218 family)